MLMASPVRVAPTVGIRVFFAPGDFAAIFVVFMAMGRIERLFERDTSSKRCELRLLEVPRHSLCCQLSLWPVHIA